jgi:molecular chaperone HscC
VDGGYEADLDVEISREEVERAWAPILDRMRAPIARALRDARVDPSELEEVIVVGGATRSPCVLDLFQALLGRAPLRSLPPDEAVAQGAAIQAGLMVRDAALEDVIITDVAPFTLGTSVVVSLGAAKISGTFAPIIDRGTTIPCSREKRLFTIDDGQTEMRIDVYQGEHSMCAENEKLGDYVVTGIPRRPRSQESVDVRFTYDMNGILEVESTVVSTGAKSTLVLERTPGRLSPEEVERARAAMKGLKIHPRETLPNTTALARAEALFAELTGMEREVLRDAMQVFRAALETQDRKLIDEIRQRLVAMTTSLR